jgi:hypothetical protein
VGFVVVGQGEARTEVLLKEGLLGVLNVLQNGTVDVLLSIESLLGNLLLL